MVPEVAIMKPLTFSAVDDLAFAAEGGHPDLARVREQYMPTTLSPLLELLMLNKSGAVSIGTDVLDARNGAESLVRAFKAGAQIWTSPDGRLGLLRTGAAQTVATTEGFWLTARRAAANKAQIPGSAPDHLVAAMAEMESNILDHSEAASTGLVVFRATKGLFEFVAADLGIGVLRSLATCEAYAHLKDHGEALRLALHEGTSRHGPGSNHGYGFRDLFNALVHLKAHLRFRSGDYALTMDGTNPGLASAQLSQKAAFKGFFVSVQCRLSGGVST